MEMEREVTLVERGKLCLLDGMLEGRGIADSSTLCFSRAVGRVRWDGNSFQEGLKRERPSNSSAFHKHRSLLQLDTVCE